MVALLMNSYWHLCASCYHHLLFHIIFAHEIFYPKGYIYGWFGPKAFFFFMEQSTSASATTRWHDNCTICWTRYRWCLPCCSKHWPFPGLCEKRYKGLAKLASKWYWFWWLAPWLCKVGAFLTPFNPPVISKFFSSKLLGHWNLFLSLQGLLWHIC